MNAILRPVRRVLDIVTNAKRYICAVMLIIMLLISFAQVVMRFIFSSPFSWSEEATLMLLVWFGYFCMSVDIYTDSHAALYFLYNKMPPVLKKCADLFRQGLLAWFFIQMVIYGMKITKLNLPKPQPATQISQGWLFAPLVVGGVSMAIYAAVNFVTALAAPLSDYRPKSDAEKTVDELNKERGGTV